MALRWRVRTELVGRLVAYGLTLYAHADGACLSPECWKRQLIHLYSAHAADPIWSLAAMCPLCEVTGSDRECCGVCDHCECGTYISSIVSVVSGSEFVIVSLCPCVRSDRERDA
jgi:hypothetical protein